MKYFDIIIGNSGAAYTLSNIFNWVKTFQSQGSESHFWMRWVTLCLQFSEIVFQTCWEAMLAALTTNICRSHIERTGPGTRIIPFSVPFYWRVGGTRYCQMSSNLSSVGVSGRYSFSSNINL